MRTVSVWVMASPASRACLRIFSESPAGEIPEEVRDIHLLAYGRVPTAGAPLLQQCVQRPPELRDQILWRNAGGRSALPDRFHATLSVMQIQEVASLELGGLN